MTSERLFETLYSKRVLQLILGLAILLFCATLWQRYAYIDDCWFAEQAYWLAIDGVVKTESIQAGLGWEDQLLVYHKLNIWIGAVIVKLAGWSIYYFKSFTLLVYLSFFYFLFRYLNPMKDPLRNKLLLLTSLLIFANPLMYIFGFTYRPEILVMIFGFITYWILEKMKSGDDHYTRLTIIAGVASGLAFLSHLNGIIFPVSGFIYLIIFKKFRAIPLYSLSVAVIASFYFIDLIPSGNLQNFLLQMKNWPDAISGNYLSGESFVRTTFLKLANEHQRFFWSDKVAIFSALFFLSVVLTFRHLVQNHRSLMIFTGLLILSLNLLGSHIAERYLIYYLPMMALIIAISLLHLISIKKYLLLSLPSFLLLLQLGILTKHGSMIIRKNSDFIRDNHEIRMMIPDSCKKILAPYHFIFNEIGNTPILTYHSLEYYEVVQRKELTGSAAMDRCRELGIDCIVVDMNIDPDFENHRWFSGPIKGNDPDFKFYRKYKEKIILLSTKREMKQGTFNEGPHL